MQHVEWKALLHKKSSAQASLNSSCVSCTVPLEKDEEQEISLENSFQVSSGNPQFGMGGSEFLGIVCICLDQIIFDEGLQATILGFLKGQN